LDPIHKALQNTHDPLQAAPRFEALYPNVDFEKRRTYLAMASAIDEVVQNVTTALKAKKLWDTTLLVFSSDNGAPGSGSNYPLRGYKLSNFEGGTRVPGKWAGAKAHLNLTYYLRSFRFWRLTPRCSARAAC
jgi:arylsulfatase A-like enzyme